MKLNEYIDILNSGKWIRGGSDVHQYMHGASQEALKITAELNGRYHTPEEIRDIFSELTGRDVDESFALFPPFYTDFGKNIKLGKNVFINMGCKFQDQGGISIGNGVLIGHNVVMATINHNMDPENRGDMKPSPIKIGNNVWIGSNVTILPGVTVGDGSVIAAGSVVNRDIPSYTVAAGVPARILKTIDEDYSGKDERNDL